jgi:cellulose synthase (UDP-forming)
MGMMGDSTGFPVVKATVVTANGVDQMSNKDLLVLGSLSRQPLVAKWVENGKLRVENGRLRVGMTSALDRVYTVLDPNAESERQRVDQLLVQQGDNLSAMIGLQSPLNSSHSAVIITGSTPDKLLTVIGTFRNRDLNPSIQGDLMIASAGRVTSFRIGDEYSVGKLPILTKLRWWLGNSPLILILFTLIGVLLIALVAYWLLRRLAIGRLGTRSVS